MRFSSTTQKNNPRTLIEQLKSDNLEIGKNADIPVNSVKSGLFNFRNGKAQPFFKIPTWNLTGRRLIKTFLGGTHVLADVVHISTSVLTDIFRFC